MPSGQPTTVGSRTTLPIATTARRQHSGYTWIPYGLPAIAQVPPGGPLAWNIVERLRRHHRWTLASTGYPKPQLETPTLPHRAIVSARDARARPGASGCRRHTRASRTSYRRPRARSSPNYSPRRATRGRVWLPTFGRAAAPPLRWTIAKAPRRPSRGRAVVLPFLAPQAAAPSNGPASWRIASSSRRRGSGAVILPHALAPQFAQGAVPATLRPITSPRRLNRGRALTITFTSPQFKAGAVPSVLRPVTSVRRPVRGRAVVLSFLTPPAASQTQSAPPWRIARSRSYPRRGSATLGRPAPYLYVAPPVYDLPRSWSIVSRKGERRALAPLVQAGRTWSAHVPPIAPTLGYRVYSNRGTMWYIDYNNPIATVHDLTWTSPPLSYPGTWLFGVRAFNGYSEEQNLDCYVKIILDHNGNNITNRPNPPTGMRAFATAGGGARVEWIYPPTLGPTAPMGFHVYIGAGATPVYGPAAATVSYGSGVLNSYVANLTGLSNGVSYAIGVRAFNATAEEPNANIVSITASNVGPSAVVGLTATATAMAG